MKIKKKLYTGSWATGPAKKKIGKGCLFIKICVVDCCKVLEVMWDSSQYETEEKIGVLLKKSLIVQHVREQTYTVLYGIHDLVLDYLKSRLSAEQQKVT